MVAKRLNLGKSAPQPDLWEAELHRRVALFVAVRGDLVRDRPSEYGWRGEDTGEREHVAGCGVNASRCSWEDITWTEFDGTFADSPYQNGQGIEASVTCMCGLVEGSRFRYCGGHAVLLREITAGRW